MADVDPTKEDYEVLLAVKEGLGARHRLKVAQARIEELEARVAELEADREDA